jgi:prepilin-type N-terminal cleavage/methylation domain-containing protein/prepilin-type processing-associated H-X9-DG protein
MGARRHGFTLVELLVVVAVIGILVALLLPAVQAAREAARRAQCRNCLRQVGVAIHMYHDAHRRLPAGGFGSIWGTWAVTVLPYIEQQAVKNQWTSDDKNTAEGYYYSDNNKRVSESRIATYTCPSDQPQIFASTVLPVKLTKHNVVVNLGNTGFIHAPDEGGRIEGPIQNLQGVRFGGAPFETTGGPGFSARQLRFDDITDGLTHTLMLSETIQGRDGPPGQHDLRGLIWWGDGTGFFTFWTPNSPEPDVLHAASYCYPDDPANPPCLAPQTAARPLTMSARSRHPHGVNVAMCDGSVHFVSDDVCPAVWRAQGTSRGGETDVPNDR